VIARTAPEWIREKKRHYELVCSIWKCTTNLDAVAFIGVCVLPLLGVRGILPNVMVVICFVALLASGLWKRELERRAKNYEAAFIVLNTAITRYEVDPNRPDSTLLQADMQASELLLRKSSPRQ
jgi:hypothetical protein